MRVFVASSSEQIAVARTVAGALKSSELDAKVWDEETFDFSDTYIESLENELDSADFAVVVVTADDSANVRRKTVNLPRDNVIFELGLFTGRLGRKRCFFLMDGAAGTHLASDLSGVNPIVFHREGAENQDAKLNYRWEGKHTGAEGQRYGGEGEIVFDDESLNTAWDHYYDTNFAESVEIPGVGRRSLTRVKHFGLYRCDAEDTRIMSQPLVGRGERPRPPTNRESAWPLSRPRVLFFSHHSSTRRVRIAGAGPSADNQRDADEAEHEGRPAASARRQPRAR